MEFMGTPAGVHDVAPSLNKNKHESMREVGWSRGRTGRGMEGQVHVREEDLETEAEPAGQGARAEPKTTTAEQRRAKIPMVEQITTTAEQVSIDIERVRQVTTKSDQAGLEKTA
ncbi:hypothetical protein QQF64_011749 [Cirrhinus molitorella]|uniref:Uncharacterized protein n=1 Tax=Cirrhinus molitorella TaxID=172907 RepID=A0ABR3LTI6_9TELE